MLMCSFEKLHRHFVTLLNAVICVCSENDINDGFVTLLCIVRFFFFFFDSVSSLPCRVCAASSELTLYGDRCLT